MKRISLSVYKVTINKYQNKDSEILTDYDHGKNLLKQVDTMFLSWKSNLSKDENTSNVCRIKKKSNTEWEYHVHSTYIDGIIESGEYGTQEEIIGVKKGERRFLKTPQDATMYPFYFMLFIRPNSKDGYLILERIGNMGILTITSKAIRENIAKELSDHYIIDIRPYIVPEILRVNLRDNGGIKKVILKGAKLKQLSESTIDQAFNDCQTQVSFVAPKNQYIQKGQDLLKNLLEKENARKDNEPYDVGSIECSSVSFELNINGSTRTVSVANLTSIGMNIDVTHCIECDGTGYPMYNSLHNEAHKILSYIIPESQI